MPPSLKDAADIARSLLSDSEPDDRPQLLVDLEKRVDPGSLYYRFLYELSKRHAPLNVFEIGTYIGASGAHLAWRNVGGRVVTVDSNPDAKLQADAIGLANLITVTSDSMLAEASAISVSPIDILYIDGNHTFTQAYAEYFLYRPLVRDGGLIVFDDVELKMAGDEMGVLWDLIPDPKEKLSFLHHTGFGIAVKAMDVFPRPWSAVIGEATRMIAERTVKL